VQQNAADDAAFDPSYLMTSFPAKRLQAGDGYQWRSENGYSV